MMIVIVDHRAPTAPGNGTTGDQEPAFREHDIEIHQNMTHVVRSWKQLLDGAGRSHDTVA